METHQTGATSGAQTSKIKHTGTRVQYITHYFTLGQGNYRLAVLATSELQGFPDLADLGVTAVPPGEEVWFVDTRLPVERNEEVIWKWALTDAEPALEKSLAETKLQADRIHAITSTWDSGQVLAYPQVPTQTEPVEPIALIGVVGKDEELSGPDEEAIIQSGITVVQATSRAGLASVTIMEGDVARRRRGKTPSVSLEEMVDREAFAADVAKRVVMLAQKQIAADEQDLEEIEGEMVDEKQQETRRTSIKNFDKLVGDEGITKQALHLAKIEMAAVSIKDEDDLGEVEQRDSDSDVDEEKGRRGKTPSVTLDEMISRELLAAGIAKNVIKLAQIQVYSEQTGTPLADVQSGEETTEEEESVIHDISSGIKTLKKHKRSKVMFDSSWDRNGNLDPRAPKSSKEERTIVVPTIDNRHMRNRGFDIAEQSVELKFLPSYKELTPDSDYGDTVPMEIETKVETTSRRKSLIDDIPDTVQYQIYRRISIHDPVFVSMVREKGESVSSEEDSVNQDEIDRIIAILPKVELKRIHRKYYHEQDQVVPTMKPVHSHTLRLDGTYNEEEEMEVDDDESIDEEKADEISRLVYSLCRRYSLHEVENLQLYKRMSIIPGASPLSIEITPDMVCYTAHPDTDDEDFARPEQEESSVSLRLDPAPTVTLPQHFIETQFGDSESRYRRVLVEGEDAQTAAEAGVALEGEMEYEAVDPGTDQVIPGQIEMDATASKQDSYFSVTPGMDVETMLSQQTESVMFKMDTGSTLADAQGDVLNKKITYSTVDPGIGDETSLSQQTQSVKLHTDTAPADSEGDVLTRRINYPTVEPGSSDECVLGPQMETMAMQGLETVFDSAGDTLNRSIKYGAVDPQADGRAEPRQHQETFPCDAESFQAVPAGATLDHHKEPYRTEEPDIGGEIVLEQSVQEETMNYEVDDMQIDSLGESVTQPVPERYEIDKESAPTKTPSGLLCIPPMTDGEDATQKVPSRAEEQAPAESAEQQLPPRDEEQVRLESVTQQIPTRYEEQVPAESAEQQVTRDERHAPAESVVAWAPSTVDGKDAEQQFPMRDEEQKPEESAEQQVPTRDEEQAPAKSDALAFVLSTADRKDVEQQVPMGDKQERAESAEQQVPMRDVEEEPAESAEQQVPKTEEEQVPAESAVAWVPSTVDGKDAKQQVPMRDEEQEPAESAEQQVPMRDEEKVPAESGSALAWLPSPADGKDNKQQVPTRDDSKVGTLDISDTPDEADIAEQVQGVEESQDLPTGQKQVDSSSELAELPPAEEYKQEKDHGHKPVVESVDRDKLPEEEIEEEFMEVEEKSPQLSSESSVEFQDATETAGDGEGKPGKDDVEMVPVLSEQSPTAGIETRRPEVETLEGRPDERSIMDDEGPPRKKQATVDVREQAETAEPHFQEGPPFDEVIPSKDSSESLPVEARLHLHESAAEMDRGVKDHATVAVTSDLHKDTVLEEQGPPAAILQSVADNTLQVLPAETYQSIGEMVAKPQPTQATNLDKENADDQAVLTTDLVEEPDSFELRLEQQESPSTAFMSSTVDNTLQLHPAETYQSIGEMADQTKPIQATHLDKEKADDGVALTTKSIKDTDSFELTQAEQGSPSTAFMPSMVDKTLELHPAEMFHSVGEVTTQTTPTQATNVGKEKADHQVVLSTDSDKGPDSFEQSPAEQDQMVGQAERTTELIPHDIGHSVIEGGSMQGKQQLITDLDADDDDVEIPITDLDAESDTQEQRAASQEVVGPTLGEVAEICHAESIQKVKMSPVATEYNTASNFLQAEPCKLVTDLDDDSDEGEEIQPVLSRSAETLTTDLDAESSSDEDYALPTEESIISSQDVSGNDEVIKRSVEIKRIQSEDITPDQDAIGTVLEVQTLHRAKEYQEEVTKDSVDAPGGEMITTATTTTATETTRASLMYEGDSATEAAEAVVEIPFLEETPQKDDVIKKETALQEESCEPVLSDESSSPDEVLGSPFTEAFASDAFSSARTTIFFRTHYKECLAGECVAVVWDTEDAKETLPSHSCVGEEIPPKSGLWYMFGRLPAGTHINWKLVLYDTESGSVIRHEERPNRKLVVPNYYTLIDANWAFDDTQIDIHDCERKLEAIPFSYDVQGEESESSEEMQVESKSPSEQEIEVETDLAEPKPTYESIEEYSESLEEDIMADAKFLAEHLRLSLKEKQMEVEEVVGVTESDMTESVPNEQELDGNIGEEKTRTPPKDDSQTVQDIALPAPTEGTLVPYMTDVFFRTHYLVHSDDEYIAVIGDSAHLGNWKVHTSIGEELPKGSGFWYVYCKLPAGLQIHWKLIVFDRRQGVFLRFEERPNRKLTVPSHPIMIDVLWAYGQTQLDVQPDETELESIPFSYVVDVPEAYRDRRIAFFGNALNIPAIALKMESFTIVQEDETVPDNLAALAKEVLTDDVVREDDSEEGGKPVLSSERRVSIIQDKPFDIQLAVVPYMTDVFIRTHYLVHSDDEYVAVIGDSDYLGNWKIHTSIGEELPKGSGFWYIYCKLPAELKIHWKLIVFDRREGRFIRFEERPNRTLVIPSHPILVDALWAYGQTPIEFKPDDTTLEDIPFSYLVDVPEAYRARRRESGTSAKAIALKYESLKVLHDEGDVSEHLAALAREVLSEQDNRIADEDMRNEPTTEEEKANVSERRVSLVHSLPFDNKKQVDAIPETGQMKDETLTTDENVQTPLAQQAVDLPKSIENLESIMSFSAALEDEIMADAKVLLRHLRQEQAAKENQEKAVKEAQVEQMEETVPLVYDNHMETNEKTQQVPSETSSTSTSNTALVPYFTDVFFRTHHLVDSDDEHVAVIGDSEYLGKWTVHTHIGEELPKGSGFWYVYCRLPAGLKVNWKLIVFDRAQGRFVRFEERPNRKLVVPSHPIMVDALWSYGQTPIEVHPDETKLESIPFSYVVDVPEAYKERRAAVFGDADIIPPIALKYECLQVAHEDEQVTAALAKEVLADDASMNEYPDTSITENGASSEELRPIPEARRVSLVHEVPFEIQGALVPYMTDVFFRTHHLVDSDNEYVAVIGDSEFLGTCKVHTSIGEELPKGSGFWYVYCKLPAGLKLNWKLIVLDRQHGRFLHFEERPNRKLVVPGHPILVDALWGYGQASRDVDPKERELESIPFSYSVDVPMDYQKRRAALFGDESIPAIALKYESLRVTQRAEDVSDDLASLVKDVLEEDDIQENSMDENHEPYNEMSAQNRRVSINREMPSELQCALVPYMTDVFFRTHFLSASDDERVAVIGDSEYLGNKKVHTSIGEELPRGSGFWYVYCKLPAGLKINWKLILFDQSEGCFQKFEERPNRKLVVPSYPIMVDALWALGQTPIEVHPDEKELESIPFSYAVDVPEAYRQRRIAMFADEEERNRAIALKYERLRLENEDGNVPEQLTALAKEVLTTDDVLTPAEAPTYEMSPTPSTLKEKRVSLKHEIQLIAENGSNDENLEPTLRAGVSSQQDAPKFAKVAAPEEVEGSIPSPQSMVVDPAESIIITTQTDHEALATTVLDTVPLEQGVSFETSGDIIQNVARTPEATQQDGVEYPVPLSREVTTVEISAVDYSGTDRTPQDPLKTIYISRQEEVELEEPMVASDSKKPTIPTPEEYRVLESETLRGEECTESTPASASKGLHLTLQPVDVVETPQPCVSPTTEKTIISEGLGPIEQTREQVAGIRQVTELQSLQTSENVISIDQGSSGLAAVLTVDEPERKESVTEPRPLSSVSPTEEEADHIVEQSIIMKVAEISEAGLPFSVHPEKEQSLAVSEKAIPTEQAMEGTLSTSEMAMDISSDVARRIPEHGIAVTEEVKPVEDLSIIEESKLISSAVTKLEEGPEGGTIDLSRTEAKVEAVDEIQHREEIVDIVEKHEEMPMDIVSSYHEVPLQEVTLPSEGIKPCEAHRVENVGTAPEVELQATEIQLVMGTEEVGRMEDEQVLNAPETDVPAAERRSSITSPRPLFETSLISDDVKQAEVSHIEPPDSQSAVYGVQGVAEQSVAVAETTVETMETTQLKTENEVTIPEKDVPQVIEEMEAATAPRLLMEVDLVSCEEERPGSVAIAELEEKTVEYKTEQPPEQSVILQESTLISEALPEDRQEVVQMKISPDVTAELTEQEAVIVLKTKATEEATNVPETETRTIGYRSEAPTEHAVALQEKIVISEEVPRDKEDVIEMKISPDVTTQVTEQEAAIVLKTKPTEEASHLQDTEPKKIGYAREWPAEHAVALKETTFSEEVPKDIGNVLEMKLSPAVTTQVTEQEAAIVLKTKPAEEASDLQEADARTVEYTAETPAEHAVALQETTLISEEVPRDEEHAVEIEISPAITTQVTEQEAAIVLKTKPTEEAAVMPEATPSRIGDVQEVTAAATAEVSGPYRPVTEIGPVDVTSGMELAADLSGDIKTEKMVIDIEPKGENVAALQEEVTIPEETLVPPAPPEVRENREEVIVGLENTAVGVKYVTVVERAAVIQADIAETAPESIVQVVTKQADTSEMRPVSLTEVQLHISEPSRTDEIPTMKPEKAKEEDMGEQQEPLTTEITMPIETANESNDLDVRPSKATFEIKLPEGQLIAVTEKTVPEEDANVDSPDLDRVALISDIANVEMQQRQMKEVATVEETPFSRDALCLPEPTFEGDTSHQNTVIRTLLAGLDADGRLGVTGDLPELGNWTTIKHFAVEKPPGSGLWYIHLKLPRGVSFWWKLVQGSQDGSDIRKIEDHAERHFTVPKTGDSLIDVLWASHDKAISLSDVTTQMTEIPFSYGEVRIKTDKGIVGVKKVDDLVVGEEACVNGSVPGFEYRLADDEDDIKLNVKVDVTQPLPQDEGSESSMQTARESMEYLEKEHGVSKAAKEETKLDFDKDVSAEVRERELLWVLKSQSEIQVCIGPSQGREGEYVTSRQLKQGVELESVDARITNGEAVPTKLSKDVEHQEVETIDTMVADSVPVRTWFRTHHFVDEGLSVGILGSLPELGAWNTAKAVLGVEHPVGSGFWYIHSPIREREKFQWKLVVVDPRTHVIKEEEERENREHCIPSRPVLVDTIWSGIDRVNLVEDVADVTGQQEIAFLTNDENVDSENMGHFDETLLKDMILSPPNLANEASFVQDSEIELIPYWTFRLGIHKSSSEIDFLTNPADSGDLLDCNGVLPLAEQTSPSLACKDTVTRLPSLDTASSKSKANDCQGIYPSLLLPNNAACDCNRYPLPATGDVQTLLLSVTTETTSHQTVYKSLDVCFIDYGNSSGVFSSDGVCSKTHSDDEVCFIRYEKGESRSQYGFDDSDTGNNAQMKVDSVCARLNDYNCGVSNVAKYDPLHGRNGSLTCRPTSLSSEVNSTGSPEKSTEPKDSKLHFGSSVFGMALFGRSSPVDGAEYRDDDEEEVVFISYPGLEYDTLSNRSFKTDSVQRNDEKRTEMAGRNSQADSVSSIICSKQRSTYLRPSAFGQCAAAADMGWISNPAMEVCFVTYSNVGL